MSDTAPAAETTTAPRPVTDAPPPAEEVGASAHAAVEPPTIEDGETPAPALDEATLAPTETEALLTKKVDNSEPAKFETPTTEAKETPTPASADAAAAVEAEAPSAEENDAPAPAKTVAPTTEEKETAIPASAEATPAPTETTAPPTEENNVPATIEATPATVETDAPPAEEIDAPATAPETTEAPSTEEKEAPASATAEPSTTGDAEMVVPTVTEASAPATTETPIMNEAEAPAPTATETVPTEETETSKPATTEAKPTGETETATSAEAEAPASAATEAPASGETEAPAAPPTDASTTEEPEVPVSATTEAPAAPPTDASTTEEPGVPVSATTEAPIPLTTETEPTEETEISAPVTKEAQVTEETETSASATTEAPPAPSKTEAPPAGETEAPASTKTETPSAEETETPAPATTEAAHIEEKNTPPAEETPGSGEADVTPGEGTEVPAPGRTEALPSSEADAPATGEIDSPAVRQTQVPPPAEIEAPVAGDTLVTPTTETNSTPSEVVPPMPDGESKPVTAEAAGSAPSTAEESPEEVSTIFEPVFVQEGGKPDMSGSDILEMSSKYIFNETHHHVYIRIHQLVFEKVLQDGEKHADTGYGLVDELIFDDHVVKDVGIRVRGSLSVGNIKRQFKFKFDATRVYAWRDHGIKNIELPSEFDDRRFLGVQGFSMRASRNDPSKVRELLAGNVFRKAVQGDTDAQRPWRTNGGLVYRADFCTLYVTNGRTVEEGYDSINPAYRVPYNGRLYDPKGLYIITEDIDKTFIKTRFERVPGEKLEGYLIQADRGQAFFDEDKYSRTGWEQELVRGKKPKNEEDLVEGDEKMLSLIRLLHSNPSEDEIRAMFDMDSINGYLAGVLLTSHWDSIAANGDNDYMFYLSRDALDEDMKPVMDDEGEPKQEKKWYMITWDLDNTLWDEYKDGSEVRNPYRNWISNYIYQPAKKDRYKTKLFEVIYDSKNEKIRASLQNVLRLMIEGYFGKAGYEKEVDLLSSRVDKAIDETRKIVGKAGWQKEWVETNNPRDFVDIKEHADVRRHKIGSQLP